MRDTGVVADSRIPYTSGPGVTGHCPSGCTGSGSYTKYHASSYKTFSTIEAIKTEISTNGPIEVAFNVYNDFFSYSTGIYQHKTGSYAGGHAVKMLGYGTENGVNYWICANSWNTSWGENGYFRIAFGQCGIEGQGTAGPAKLPAS